MTSVSLNYFLKTLYPNTVTLGVKASAYEWGRGTDTFQFIAVLLWIE